MLDIFYKGHLGNITSRRNGSCVYSVQSIKDLAVIIDHFDKYPLITKKGADYLLFKMAVNLIQNKEHLTMVGLRKIVAIRASMNWGLPFFQKYPIQGVKLLDYFDFVSVI